MSCPGGSQWSEYPRAGHEPQKGGMLRILGFDTWLKLTADMTSTFM
jgi:hypothetical protein